MIVKKIIEVKELSSQGPGMQKTFITKLICDEALDWVDRTVILTGIPLALVAGAQAERVEQHEVRTESRQEEHMQGLDCGFIS